MPEKAGRIRNGKFFLPVSQHCGPHGGHNAQHDHSPEHGDQQLYNPVRMLKGKHIINKNLRHDRNS
jgi:hypothetical protein